MKDLQLDKKLEGNDGTTKPVTIQALLDEMIHSPVQSIQTLTQQYQSTTFDQFPITCKDTYINRFKMSERVLGNVSVFDMIHTSSGSSGSPTFWGRTRMDEQYVETRFQQILHDNLNVQCTRTLAIIAFPLGSWVGGIFTTFCLRDLKALGYQLTIVTCGNQPDDIIKTITNLSDMFEQTCIFGYPPFVKSVIDKGLLNGIQWSRYNLAFVFAGEVFSEEWRLLIGTRAGIQNPLQRIISIYGTADAGVIAQETLLSSSIRSFIASNPQLVKILFGKNRIPSLMQYDPTIRYLELHPTDHTIVLTTLPVIQPSQSIKETVAHMTSPLIRYNIGDDGGIMDFKPFLNLLISHGFQPPQTKYRELPFVWVFGRSFWTVSLYGANVYVENIMVGLEHPKVCDMITGKFVLQLTTDPDDLRLHLHIELIPNQKPSIELTNLIGECVVEALKRLNSEFCHYIPEDKQIPLIELYTFGDSVYFPIGVKHKYII
ncbi:hypothetical protein BC833DRAFT_609980 [Globomyces pollinis-pini]|nr:hypothetical protein BC833DRAFT_609980 [Globomyces pollinis-pini]